MLTRSRRVIGKKLLVSRGGIPSTGLQFYADLWNYGQQGFLAYYDSNDYFSRTVANYRSADSEGAIEIWFRTSYTASYQSLFASADTGTETSYFHFFIAGTTGKLQIETRNAGGTYNSVSGATNVADGKWHHAKLSSNGTAWNIDLDGVTEILSIEGGSNTGDWFSDITLRDNIAVGVLLRGATAGEFNGEIGFTRLYSRPMLQPEAQVNYQRGRRAAPSDTTGLVGSWDFTEGSGDTAVDTIAAENLTRVGATWVEGLIDRSPNALALTSFGSPTRSNQGRTLNGTTQYLTTPHSSALDFERTDKFALAAWVKTASAGNGNSILSKQLNSGNYNGYTMELANSGKLYMNLINDVYPSQYTSVSSTNSVNDDEWHFILAQNKALAGGAGSDIEIFIDAVQETPVIAVDTLGSNSILTTTSLDIGARTGGQLIAATIGEVWVYSGTFSLPGVIRFRNATRWRYV